MIRRSYAGNLPDTLWPFALADREVSYVGEPVALVVADSRYVAEDAAAPVEVDYEALPAASIAATALRAGAPAVRRELAANNIASLKVSYGDVAAAFASPRHLVRDRALAAPRRRPSDRGPRHPGRVPRHRRRHHGLGLDPEGARPAQLAQLPASGSTTTGCASRRPTSAAASGRSSASIPRTSRWWRRRGCSAARSNGSRTGASISPMRCRSATSTGSSRSRSTATRRILGIRGRLLHDQGAYALQDVNQPYNSAKALTGPYLVPALHMDIAVARPTRRRSPRCAAPAIRRPSFAMERLLDAVARELGIDRAELRRRNLIPADKMPYELPLKERSGAAIDLRQRRLSGLPGRGARWRPRWDDFPRRQARGARAGPLHRHRPRACAQGHRPRAVRVRHRADRAVRARLGLHRRRRDGAGAQDRAGADLRAELGMQGRGYPRRVAGDTATVAVGLGGFASRQTVTAGSSVMLAARAVRDKAKKLASHLLEAAEHDLEVVDGAVRVVGAPQARGRARRARRACCRARPATAFRRASMPGSTPASITASMRSPTRMPAMSPRSRSISRPAACASCATARSRTPAR